MKYLRREKDLAVAKFDVLRTENTRLKSQIEIAERRLEEAKSQLNAEREKTEIDVVAASKHSELLRKVETLNAITDSNRALREERNSLATKVQELTSKLNSLTEKFAPLREKSRDLETQVEMLQQENTALKADTQRWRQRAEELVEKTNKASPEDWRRLQTERENLSKLLISEREVHAKYVEEFNALKTEKMLLDERTKQTSVQIQVQEEQINNLTQEMGKLSQQLNECVNESRAKDVEIENLRKELINKEALLQDSKNKEMQIRKIAKKYKTQYEELTKSGGVDKSKEEGQAGLTQIGQETQELRARIEELTVQVQSLHQDLENKKLELSSVTNESATKEERAKSVLKSARTKIMQLTESKKQNEELIKELRTKMEESGGGGEGDIREEHEARLMALKSQMETRISR